MKRAALITIPSIFAALHCAGGTVAQSLTEQRPTAQSVELEDGWVHHRSSGFELEVPRGYTFVDVTAPDVEYRRERLFRQWPDAKTMLDDPEVMQDVVLVGMDRGTMKSHFVDHFFVFKMTSPDLTPEAAESKAGVEAFAAQIKAKAAADGDLFEMELFEWRPGKMAVRKKTTRTKRTPRGRYLKLITLEHWAFHYPDLWYLAFNTVTEREDSVRHLAQRTTHSLIPLEPDSTPAIKMMPRTAGDVSLMLPEGFELVSLTGDADPQRERVAEQYPDAQPLIERYMESKRIALGFDPQTLDGRGATTISFARYPMSEDAAGEARSVDYVKQYVARLREKWEGQGFSSDAILLFPLGHEGPVYRYDYSSAPASEGGERVVRRQLAYFAPPQIWLMTFTLRASQADAVERYLSEVAASFAPLEAGAAAPPVGSHR